LAVEAGLAGVAGGTRFEGRTLIAAPVEMTGDGTVAALEAGHRSQGWVAAELELNRLFRVRRDYPIARLFNAELYGQAFPKLYEARQAGGAAAGRAVSR